MKLEDNFKDKLEGRRIVPTASAWDRIEGKLEAAEGKKKSRVVLWIGIAASFVAGVFLTASILNSDSGTMQTPMVLSPNDIEISKETNRGPIKSIEQEGQNVVQVVTSGAEKETTVEGEVVVVKKAALQKAVAVKEAQAPVKNYNRNAYKLPISKKSKEETAVATASGKNTLIIKEDVVNVPVIEDSNIGMAVASSGAATVTDAEVDALLKNAQRNVQERSNIASRVTTLVNANELLLDAEAEVDPDSFKDRMFKTLKKEVNRAIEAVANKDN